MRATDHPSNEALILAILGCLTLALCTALAMGWL